MAALYVLLLILPAIQLSASQSDGYNCSAAYQRYPVNDDMAIDCGPQYITLTINLCPIIFSDFKPDEIALNGNYNISNCKGAIDNTTTPPVLRYIFPVNDTNQNTCNNNIEIITERGTGIYSQFSNIQSVVISGYANTPQSATGVVSYSTDLNYLYSCYYPLEYLLNNTQLITATGAVAVTTNNGSFISTLSMKLYGDASFTTPMNFSASGIPLKTKIFVEVRSTNLSASLHVLMDACFATPTPIVSTVADGKFEFFTGCTVDKKTVVLQNGNDTWARFSFDAFRFVSQRNQNVSTIYVHCMTRLCTPSDCKAFLGSCSASNATAATSGKRRKRAASGEKDTSDQVLLSSGPVLTKAYDSTESSGKPELYYQEAIKEVHGTLSGLIAGLIIAALLAVGIIILGVILFKKYHARAVALEKKDFNYHN
ncbi:zona pellucida-like domain-containing protein 1 [Protopterus annectens]|uniref:zona pellucida-like domain-containing protein 1 n=1 Tax=Protopterus annectens TaxID=7888 RepID=UPI001CFB5C53|nr:zona pellucida-like domain-containing protein 1 [Protopterus annectens]